MMLMVGEDGKGNVIVKIGKTDKEIILLNEKQYSVLQELVSERIIEDYIQCLNMLLCHEEETLADMAKMMELGTTEMHEERRMVNTYQEKSRVKIKNRIWQQAKSTLKYKRYELRIYTSLF